MAIGHALYRTVVDERKQKQKRVDHGRVSFEQTRAAISVPNNKTALYISET